MVKDPIKKFWSPGKIIKKHSTPRSYFVNYKDKIIRRNKHFILPSFSRTQNENPRNVRKNQPDVTEIQPRMTEHPPRGTQPQPFSPAGTRLKSGVEITPPDRLDL